ncbi:Transcription initiation factor TFIID subunit 11 [Echinococcus granulosus]|uniref:Transcription initiation factor TFIID subunit 11 n=1 Tax=Echinococcus granulosus TaxID=6210 RepID=A0A068WII4_ECHGR|nr:Transcription initiation factor TFIID subunit 11 [Echinococcus granulosus]CDS17498.1 Transcription initiation factor TFIID subunit [Echinococcus granulosus]
MDSISSPLKRELEGVSTANGPPSKKRSFQIIPNKSVLSAPEKNIKLDPRGLYVKECGSEAVATEDDELEEEDVEELFGDDEEDDDEGELELEEEVDEEDDEEQDETERLAEVLGVEVFERGDGASSNTDRPSITPADQQEETNRAEDRKLLALMAHFNDDQLSRFESYRRATFTKSAVSRLIQSVAQTSFSQNVVIAMAGITKVFVGELVETALDYKEELQETGPLQPKHIRVAYARLKAQERTSRQSRLNPLL